MAKIVTMGEIMLRLSTPGNEKFIQADEFDVCYGGGEANVAVSLANYGHDVQFVTKVPENPIGECAIAALRKMNVCTKHIAKGGERLGIYFLETGAAMRASNVVYDRAHSSISTATAEDFDFDEIFKGVDWFHFTGITPAISDAAAELTKVACKAAKKAGVKVSCDLNFRKKLWSSQKAQKVMSDLMQYVDICIGNEEDAEKVLGFKPGNTDVTTGERKIRRFPPASRPRRVAPYSPCFTTAYAAPLESRNSPASMTVNAWAYSFASSSFIMVIWERLITASSNSGWRRSHLSMESESTNAASGHCSMHLSCWAGTMQQQTSTGWFLKGSGTCTFHSSITASLAQTVLRLFILSKYSPVQAKEGPFLRSTPFMHNPLASRAAS